MGEQRCEIVRAGIAGERRRSGEGNLRIAGIEVNVGVENLPDLGGGRAAADLHADAIGGDDAGEGEHAGSERAVGLIETARDPNAQLPHHHTVSKTLSGRFGTPQEIAAAVRFLAGPDARYITGQTLHVNGGVYLG